MQKYLGLAFHSKRIMGESGTASPIIHFVNVFALHMGLVSNQFTTCFARPKPFLPTAPVYLGALGNSRLAYTTCFLPLIGCSTSCWHCPLI